MVNAAEGTYSAHADSPTSVCPTYRLGLILHIQTTKAGVDGLQITLGKKELAAIKIARQWTQWDSKTNLRMGRKRKTADSAPPIVLLDDDNDDQEAEDQPDQPASSAKAKPKLSEKKGVSKSGSAGVKPTIKSLGTKK